MFKKFKDTVKDFSEDVKSTVTEKEITEDELDSKLENLRLQLLQNNVSLEATEKILEKIEQKLLGQKVKRTKVEENVKQAVKEALNQIIEDQYNFDKKIQNTEKPVKIFFMGFNGSGKTTTTAKIAKKLQNQGKEVVMGAGDTFRAASIEQLEEHGEKLGTKIIKHEYEADPAAVAYDTIEHAKNENKIALVDTAGRSHADQNLMQELQKMVRVNEPDISFLVIDALSGNDVTEQLEAYEGMFDAIIVTKMDIDDKGGVIITAAQKSGKPIAFVGTGQDYNDLETFNKKEFIENLLE